MDDALRQSCRLKFARKKALTCDFFSSSSPSVNQEAICFRTYMEILEPTLEVLLYTVGS